MKHSEIAMNHSNLVEFLKKPASEFTRNDIVHFCDENKIEMVNFRYVAGDSRLKTLNFPIKSRDYLETILTHGERVDGSSLFSFIESASSDLYVLPRYRTAFLNPFAEVPTLDIFCSFYTNEGKSLESDPYYVLRKASKEFTRETGYNFLALGELEYYVVAPMESAYPGVDQKGYHDSEPFAKYEYLRNEALQLISNTGCAIKYGHSEVGCFSDGDTYYEQHEIEFLPTMVERTAEQILLAKWILRKLGYKYGVDVSYAPKISVGKAGSGMHIHMMIEKDGENLTAIEGKLSDMSRKMIAGILDSADALTAFGNTVPLSYLRLVPHQEAPTSICWGDRNRSVLVRVPLGWNGSEKMIRDANPQDTSILPKISSKQTFEFRVPDGSADIYLILAGLVVTALRGINMPNALEIAKRLYVNVNIFKPEHKEKLSELKKLPFSCDESADALEKKRSIFEKNQVFPKGLIDTWIKKLKSYNDKGLSEKLYGRTEEIEKMVNEFIHVG